MKKINILLILFLFISAHSFGVLGRWTAGTNFPAVTRSHYFQFAINGKGYLGSGSYVNSSNLVFVKDVWEFDPVVGTWTQVADFGGNIRTGTMYCSLNGYGYAGCGADQFTTYNDWWQFDPVANTWSQKAYFPAATRVYGQGFSTATLAYCGLGRVFTPAGSTLLLNDVYSYDPLTDTWQSKNNFTGATRSFATSFNLKGSVYILGGQSGSPVDGFLKYDEVTDSWLAKNNFPGGARIGMTSFVINDTAYAGFGRSQDQFFQTTYYNDMWQYDDLTDTWTLMQALPATERFRAYGFAFDSLGYIGCGENVANTFNDGWIFNPRLQTPVGLNTIALQNIHLLNSLIHSEAVIVNPGQQDYTYAVYSVNGQLRYHGTVIHTPLVTVDLSNESPGIYFICLSNPAAEKVVLKVMKN